MSDLVVARNCCMTRVLPGEAELVSEAKSVKRFERSNGLDTALYKNPFFSFSTENQTFGLESHIEAIHITGYTR